MCDVTRTTALTDCQHPARRAGCWAGCDLSLEAYAQVKAEGARARVGETIGRLSERRPLAPVGPFDRCLGKWVEGLQHLYSGVDDPDVAATAVVEHRSAAATELERVEDVQHFGVEEPFGATDDLSLVVDREIGAVLR